MTEADPDIQTTTAPLPSNPAPSAAPSTAPPPRVPPPLQASRPRSPGSLLSAQVLTSIFTHNGYRLPPPQSPHRPHRPHWASGCRHFREDASLAADWKARLPSRLLPGRPSGRGHQPHRPLGVGGLWHAGVLAASREAASEGRRRSHPERVSGESNRDASGTRGARDGRREWLERPEVSGC